MHWIYWKTTAGKHTHTLVSQLDWWPLFLVWLHWTLSALHKQRILQESTGHTKIWGIWRCWFFKETCNKGVLFAWISWETQDALLRWKQDTSACTSFCAGCFPTICSLLLSLGPGRNGEWFRRFQWRSEHSPQPVTIPSHFFRSISLTFSLTLSFIWHPSHLSPACRHIYNPTAGFLFTATFPVLHHFSLSSPTAMIPVTSRLYYAGISERSSRRKKKKKTWVSLHPQISIQFSFFGLPYF